MYRKFAGLLAAMLLASPLALAATPAPEGAAVYFIEPADGAEVTSPVTVKFGLKGMGVAPAGVEKAATGHHHLIIDADPPPAGQPVPSNDNYRHFGGGQTEVSLDLAPGTHTLQLIMGDMAHIPHDPPVMSERITITVQ
ncbi:DUF4399 domain-containing protein [Thioalbus denitrificans]|uniref:Uncharacterized protein DUF4399 n=1 Tax=Thioalbus denitrificans TaxID=547122 RepID=A0A369CG27_9GAMM|nr:DUF4399 domain-containing protein [Thioalbus denitrificans]RCX32188.1 uncharacterized protein DUF4399 [Thioalbus denitrificans]